MLINSIALKYKGSLSYFLFFIQIYDHSMQWRSNYTKKYLTSSLPFLWSIWLLRSFSIFFSFRSFPLFQVFQSLSWSFILFFPAMQWSILFLLPCGLQYYASYVIVFGRFHVSPIHRHDFILSKVCCFCLIHSNNCSLHGSSGPRRK